MSFFLPILIAIIIYLLAIGTAILIYRIRTNRRQINDLVARQYSVLEILVPKNNDKGPLAAENMFAALHGIFNANTNIQEHISFEIAARDKFILFYVYTPTHLKDFVEGQIYAQYPTVEIHEVSDYTTLQLGSLQFAGTELVLNNVDIFPIKTFISFEVDPLAGVTGVLSKVADQEQIWLQVLVRPVGDSWKNRGVQYINAIRRGQSPNPSGMGVTILKNIFSLLGEIVRGIFVRPTSPEAAKSAEAPQLSGLDEAGLKAIEEKITKLGFETRMRIIAVSPDQPTADQKIHNLVGAFKQFNLTHLNGFSSTPLTHDRSFLELYQQRRFGQPGYILNITEVASIYHLPNITVETPLIVWAGSKKGEPPANLPIAGSAPERELTVFGVTNFRHLSHQFGIKIRDRRLHMYTIGKTGTGKSTMLENMIIDDIREGRGVAVIDPHGDLIDRVLNFIPDERIDQVIWFAPWDRDHPIGFNVLEQVEPDLRGVVASGVVGIYKKIFGESWGPRLEYILRNAVLSLLEYPNATMLGITKILVDKNYRQKVVGRITDIVVKDFWINEFEKYDPKFRTEAVAPIQNKVGQFLSSATIRNIIGQPGSTIDLRDIMDQRKIFLIDLSIGKIGEDASALMGAMMITKIQLTAMQRANVPEPERTDFYLYVDEFQNFATESFAVILSEARKYHLNLVMTHQFIAQMPEIVAKAVFGNVGSIVSFRVGSQDSTVLAQEFEPVFTANDLVNLDNYHVYVKMAIDGVTSPAFSAVTLPPAEGKTGNKEKVIEASRRKFSRSRGVVEQLIHDLSEEDSRPVRLSSPVISTTLGRVEGEEKFRQKGDSQGRIIDGYIELTGPDGKKWYLPKESASPPLPIQTLMTEERDRAPVPVSAHRLDNPSTPLPSTPLPSTPLPSTPLPSTPLRVNQPLEGPGPDVTPLEPGQTVDL